MTAQSQVLGWLAWLGNLNKRVAVGTVNALLLCAWVSIIVAVTLPLGNVIREFWMPVLEKAVSNPAPPAKAKGVK